MNKERERFERSKSKVVARIARLKAEAIEYKQSLKDAKSSVLYRRYWSSARKRHYSFDLTPIQFNDIITAVCYYCGGPGGGIDRYDNSQGYTIDNSVSCCGTCNRMKFTLSADEFYAHIRRLSANLDTLQHR